MKKYFIMGLAIILILSIGIINYGAWLNERGEFQITRRMEENRLEVPCSKVTLREISPRVQISTVNLYSNAMADAVALIDGTLSQVLQPKNSFVRQGDTIFIIENEDIALQLQEAEANILKANSELKRAANTFQRYKLLIETEAVSAVQYDEAEAAFVAAEASLKAAQAKKSQLIVQNSRQQVTAPIDGKILVIYRQQGAYVQAGTSLALVGNFSTLYFTLPVEDSVARYLSVGQVTDLYFNKKDFQKVYSTDFETGNLGSNQTFSASIVEITPPLSEPAAMRNVLFEVDNKSGILEPQTYGAVSFKARNGHKCLTVPLSAMADKSKNSIFTVKADNTIEKRSIKTGANDGKYIEVISGLKESDVVVTGGIEGLVDGIAVTVNFEDEES